MYRKDYIEKELEKLFLLLGKIIGLKKENKPFLEIETAVKEDLLGFFGEDLFSDDPNLIKYSPQKQQALADILFELGVTAHQQNKNEACGKFLKQFLHILSHIEKNSDTFSFQNAANKGIAEQILNSEVSS